MTDKTYQDLEFRVDGDFTYGIANPENLPDYVLEDDFESRLHLNALRVMGKKYLKRDESGNIIQSPRERVYNITRTMAEVERQYGASDEEIDQYTKEFYQIISNLEFSPGGRVWSNAGTGIGALFNCYVIPVPDSIEGIYKQSVANQALIQKEGGGTGFNFSDLRPRGTYVVKSKGVASGVVSFIEQFDKVTEIINSGNRRGANMGIVNVDHPDILDFIYAKSMLGKLTNFNISIGANDEFMKSVKEDSYYKLHFNDKPFTKSQLENIIKNIEENIGGAEVGQKPRPPSLLIAENGVNLIDSYKDEVIGKIENDEVYLHGGKIMDKVADLAWETGDPGMIFLDTINNDNPLINIAPIKATNPCGEQPLHPYDACNLGSVNLEKMVRFENGNSSVDYDKLGRVTKTAIRFMDNVNDASKGPIPEVEQTVLNHRRTGLGVMGWSDMLVQLGIQYDSEEALGLAEKIMTFISEKAKKTSHELAIEKEVFPMWEKSTYALTGKEEDKVRNLQRTTIAPTGTIAMIDDVASGIEPFYALAYTKNIRGGETFQYFNRHLKKIAKERGFWSEEFRKKVEENGSIQNLDEVPDDVKALFKGAYDISHEWHVKMEVAFQRGTDNAISKTINMINSVTPKDVKNVYLSAWEEGLKGITIYRDGSKPIQVLEVKRDGSLENLLNKPRPEVEGTTKKIKTMHGSIFVTMNKVEGTNRPYETIVEHGKSGGLITSYTEALGRAISVGLQVGVPPEVYIEQFKGIEAGVFYDNGKKILSGPDGIAQVMEEFFLGNKNKKTSENQNDISEEAKQAIGEPCTLTKDCKGTVIHAGGCVECNVCGESLC